MVPHFVRLINQSSNGVNDYSESYSMNQSRLILLVAIRFFHFVFQGNHGEDVKELYYHLDATPTTSYAKALYKYPQAEYPYSKINEENRNRGKGVLEFELEDAGN